jgi:hypothetical protein
VFVPVSRSWFPAKVRVLATDDSCILDIADFAQFNHLFHPKRSRSQLGARGDRKSARVSETLWSNYDISVL